MSASADYIKMIEIYGSYVDDTEISPFENHYAFHIRSNLHNAYKGLSSKERELLAQYDLVLKENAKPMFEHLGRIYDFSSSNKPDDEWWWHLDRLVK